MSSAFWAPDLFGYVLGTVLVLGVGLPVERRVGSARVVAVALLAQVAGVLATMAFWQLIRPLAGEWLMARMYLLGPGLMVWGVAAAGTAAMGTLWRRRLRLGIFALLVLLALYSGGFADLARLVAGVTGALLGPWCLGRRARRQIFVSSRHEGRVLIAVLVAVSAVGPVIAGLVPHAMGPLSVLRLLFTGIEPVDAQTVQDLCTAEGQRRECEAARLQLRAGAGGLFMAIVPSVLLLLLAEGLRRGRRFAWGAVLVLQSCLSALSLLVLIQVLQSTGQDSVAGEVAAANPPGGIPAHPLSLVVPLLMPLLLLSVVFACRRLFPVAAPPGTYPRLTTQLLGLAFALAVVYVGAGLALAQDFSPVPTPAALLADVPDRFLPLGFAVDVPPAFFPQTFPAIVLYEGIGIVFWAVTGALVLRTFLSSRPARTGDDKAKARAILKAAEGSSISWMTLWSGNTYWFSSAGDSFIAYRVIASVALTLGGPVGPKTRTTGLITEFSAYCRANGWTPCLYSVPKDVRDEAVALGWEAAEVGQDTVLPLENLSFKGKRFQDIRTALNRAAKAGIHAEWINYPAAARGIQSQIQEVSEEWVAERNMPEMGFTLGGLDELNDPKFSA